MVETEDKGRVDYNKLATKVQNILVKDRHVIERNSPHVLWASFVRGVMFGMGTVFGATLIVLVVGFVVAQFGGIPVIGQFLQSFGQALTTTH